MSDLKILKVKRASIRGRLTKFKNYLDLLITAPSLSESQVNELKLKAEKIKEQFDEYGSLQDQIDELCIDTISDEIDERDTTDSQFVSLLAKSETILKKYSTDNNDFQSVESEPQPHQSHNEASFKLPIIQISKFDGNFAKWLEFRDTFKTLIHNNPRLLPIHKFHYLNSYLQGEAARVLANLEVSSESYEAAWDLLCQRYDNKRHLINNHLNSLFNIEPIGRESEKSLRLLVDHVNKDLRALSSLGQPTDQWDTLIIHMICMKLDNVTKRAWEEHRNSFDSMPTLSQLSKFLQNRADVLETCYKKQSNTNNNYNATSTNYLNKSYKTFACTTSPPENKESRWVCNYCSKDHSIYTCPQFLSMTPEQRRSEAYKLKLCPNCLRKGHNAKACRSGPCRECRKRHNSLLHSPSPPESEASVSVQPALTTPAAATANPPTVDVTVNFSAPEPAIQVLLSTAIIKVTNPSNNKEENVRCLLDSGSQATFITKSLQEKLGLETIPTKAVKIMGMANMPCGFISERSIVRLDSLHTDFNVTLTCSVLPELTGKIPKTSIDRRLFNLPPKIELADPSFNNTGPIELLIGADLFWQIVGREQRSLGTNLPFLRSSQLGWLISGPIFVNCEPKTVQCNFSRSDENVDNFDQQLSRFWELEELPKRPLLSDIEKECELHFKTHTTRQENGRFCVKLPLKESPGILGDSYQLARQRFLSLEKKFRKNPELKNAYCDFITEYREMGHCSEAREAPPRARCYYLCHHAVLRAHSESTKLRVVFDGSAATTTGVSVNDLQYIGPKVQDSLLSILLRFRIHKFVLAGDIDKFFRQVLVHEDDRDLQLILWRENENQPIITLRLNTVTYGFASASYLSTKCLWQLGEESNDSKIKEIIQKDFYCDDLLTGADTKEELLHILNAVTTTLKSGCFNLRKFRSNAPDIFPISTVDLQSKLSLSDSSSALGLGWSPQNDELHFTIDISSPESTNKITKRSILSSSFSIFDPLGLLSPCTIQPKMLMQQLWRRGLDWDEPVPQDLQKEWQRISTSFPSLSNMSVQRRAVGNNPEEVQVHSFCDASMLAYGACVYLRSTDKKGNVKTNLLCAKSRVARTKPPLTIPKLELLGALLASNLTKTVLESLRCPISTCVHWCDSSVVLAWLNTSPSKLKSFVANKVVEICENTNLSSWRHVPTALNPADFISRGLPAEKLPILEMWWSGPSFLAMDQSQRPLPETKKKTSNNYNEEHLPEMKVLATTHADDEPEVLHIENFSQLNKLKRTFAYVLRFVHNLKIKNTKTTGPLSVDEIKKSFSSLVRQAQKQSFAKEYHALSQGKCIGLKSNISSLSPFLDDDRVMRVGGRLDRSDYSYDKKHPVILDSAHHLTKLIFRHEHLRQLHAGPQLLLYSIRDSIWPVCGRRLARSTVRTCVVCRRHKGQTLTPKMGNLPPQRIMPALPFQSIGMDFAGPFNIINKKGRGARVSKCYLCLYVCFRYKCVHLEAVSDLSKEAFILSLRRFVSRRGKPLEIFCDNGRNFVAASKEVGQFLKSNAKPITELAADMQIKFNFHPPYAPHFSGLAEAGIKSAKHHIKRVMGNTNLTFEELSTLFAQVEAIMNSRPLSPLSSSPTDYLPLSPAHFLVGRPLTSLPSPAIDETRPCRSRYEAIERMRQQFWCRWQRDYISELQQRTKWRNNQTKLAIGDLVLIQEDNTPPLNWRLGRIAKLYPGDDGISRVADITTSRGCIRRALTRLCPLLDSTGPGVC